jgi:hypothetical protein
LHDSIASSIGERLLSRAQFSAGVGAARRGPTTAEPQPPSSRQFKAERWHALELFIAAQFLWGALLFVPGARAFRAIIRALPYVSTRSWRWRIRRVPKLQPPIAASFLVGALAVMVVNLLWPTTQLSADSPVRVPGHDRGADLLGLESRPR